MKIFSCIIFMQLPIILNHMRYKITHSCKVLSRKMGSIFLVAALSAALLLGSMASYASWPIKKITTNGATTSLAPMLKTVLPGVVNIAVHGELPLIYSAFKKQHPRAKMPPIPKKFAGLGSGVIVDSVHGYILTNAHLIKDAQIIMITLKDGRRMRAKVIGYDVPSDIAALQVTAKHLTALPFGDSDKLNVGDLVAAIGNPFGLQQTVTSGVISGLERSNLGLEGYEDFIQTDAPINPGNSGGALINMQGKLIGINTAILSAGKEGGNIGIGFAIPSNMAKNVMLQLIKYGKVERGMLGVGVQNVTPALAGAMGLPNTKGALVSQVLPNSPAAKAGLKVKDTIISLNGKPVRSAFQVSNTVSLMRVGAKISIQVRRQNKFYNLKATIANMKQFKKVASIAAKQVLAGIALQNFNQLLDNKQVQGVQVLYVADTGIAFTSGLRPGDIILSAANQPVHSIEELQKIARKSPKRLLLEIKRGLGGDIFLVLEE